VRWLASVLAGVALCAAGQPAAQPRFRAPPDAAAPSAATQLLTDEERAYVAALPVVRVAVPSPPAEPYEVIGGDGVVSGIHVEMLTAIGRAFGIRMAPVVVQGWPAVLEAARRRDVDIVMTVGVTAERTDYLAFTLGVTPWPGALFTRRGAAPVDLATARFALERDYMANDFVRRQYPKAHILTAETTIEALRAVADGRADCYLGSLLEATAWLAREPVPGVQATRGLDYGTGHYHFGVRNDWAPLAAILNKGIQGLHRQPNGPFDAALAALPPGLRPPPALALDAGETGALLRHPIWRVGAVRGLALLNDVDERGVHSGIASEYVEQVARRLGVGTVVVPFPSVAAMLDALRTGEIDVVPFLTRTPARELEFTYSRPYVEMPYMLVARGDGPLYWSLGSLAGRRLALARQHPLREVIASDYPEVHVVDADDGNVAMDMVARGAADAAVEVKLFANLRINADNRLRTTTTIEELPAAFAFATSRRAAELVPLIDRALDDIAPPEHRRMLRRWVAIDLQPGFPWRRYAPVIGVSAAALLALAGLTWWWMRRLQREVRVRRRSEELLNDVATTVPGVAFRYVFDEDGRLRHHYFSPGASTFLGVDLDPARTVLAALAPRLPVDQREAALALETQCLRSGERLKLTAAYEPPSAAQRWLHIEAVRTRVAAGRTVWTGYIVDVTPEHELQDRLVHEAQARNLLLATASHELRAPTHNLSLALDAMSIERLDAQDAVSLRLARRSAQTLGQLLNDVLDTAKFDSGTIRLNPRPFDLHEMLQELHDTWQMAAGERGLAFAMTVGPDVPRQVALDPLRLKQILTNLLSNACKFTAEGLVSLDVSRDTAGLRFVVRDTGIGMAPEELGRLFQPFVTLDAAAASASSLPSTGLGMLVSRKLGELMGGSVTLRSSPGAGTEATLLVPLTIDVPVPAAARAAGRVLVCDDDPTSRLLSAQMLRSRGFDVSEAGDAEAALQVLREGNVAALVTDLALPGMSGHDLIRAVRSFDATTGTRTIVIVCSGSEPAQVPSPVEGSPYDAWLLKPVTMDALVATLERLGVHGRALVTEVS
jgi:two-component system sensor histidine kinase EvgS